MTDRPETALARWSRLKRAGAEPQARIPRDDQLPAAAPALSHETGIEPVEDRSGQAPPERDDATPALDLPDIASLNAESDFSVFLREGVSEEIRRKALRVLWRSDPVLANLDGLNDYDEDFRASNVLVEAVRTAYKAGKGYLRNDDEQPAPEGDVTPEDGLPEPEDTETAIAPARDAAKGPEPTGDGPDSEDGPEEKS